MFQSGELYSEYPYSSTHYLVPGTKKVCSTVKHFAVQSVNAMYVIYAYDIRMFVVVANNHFDTTKNQLGKLTLT